MTERRSKAVDAIHCLLRFTRSRLVRILSVCIVASYSLLSLTSCGYIANDNQPAKIRLTVWSMWSGQEEKNFQQVLDRYQQLHPNISIENLGAVNDDTKTVRAIVAGVPPDLCTLSDPFFLGPLATNGAIYPLDEWFAKSGLQEKDFISASLRQCRFKDRLFAMPFLIDCMALLWNKKIFREANLDPERPPLTTEEMEAIAVKLTMSDANGISRLGLMPVNDENMISQIFGGQLYDPKSNQVTPDHPGNLAALKWYAGLIGKMGGYQKVNEFSSGFGKDQSANNPFFMGKVAMMLNGEWNPRWCDKYAPGLDYGVAPLPYPSSRPELKRSTWLGGNVFCIPKGGKHPKEAWDLLVWMQTDEAQILLASLNNNIPNRRSALKSAQLREGAPYKQKFAVYLDLADTQNAGCFPVLPVANMYSNELVTARELVLTGEKQPEEALRDVRLRVQRELDKYK